MIDTTKILQSKISYPENTRDFWYKECGIEEINRLTLCQNLSQLHLVYLSLFRCTLAYPYFSCRSYALDQIHSIKNGKICKTKQNRFTG